MTNMFLATAPFLSQSQPLIKRPPHNHFYASSSQPPEQQKRKKSSVETTDWVASSLTRRFGIGAGLGWAGFLAFGVISEQIKTRIEVSQEEANTRDVEGEQEIVLPNGIRYPLPLTEALKVFNLTFIFLNQSWIEPYRYYDLRLGGGATPRPGDLVVINLKGQVEGTGQVFVDTYGSKEEKKKPLALVLGSKPYRQGLCEGIDYVLRSIKAGGKRRVIVPPSLGFGEDGTELDSGFQIPPNASLEYIVEVVRVSIAPA